MRGASVGEFCGMCVVHMCIVYIVHMVFYAHVL